MASDSRVLRRGLPRVPGGEPWPAAGARPAGAPSAAGATVPGATAAGATASTVASRAASTTTGEDPGPAAPALTAPAPTAPTAPIPAAPSVEASSATLRRGLPRTPGGEPWPPAGIAPLLAPAPAATRPKADTADPEPARDPESVTEPRPAPDPEPEPSPALAVERRTGPDPEPAPASRRPARWVRIGALGALGAVTAAGVLVLAARGVTTLPGVPEFLERHPGEYRPPVEAEAGFPAWARWTHFLNFFFLALIVRSGLLVRRQQRPPAFYTPKRGGKKVSIHLWLHTSLDVLWLLNGVVFVVLLFATGHWIRIVPTSWEVFPNASSALLQYLTLDWPLENGWVNYNGLQQLMYFLVVFVAAPLAAITGIRMSEWWPKDAPQLDRWYPAAVARALHFPTMLFFVLFVIVHVFLVLATGALRNLNHMYAGQDTVSWVGFWWFAAGLGVTLAALAAARPLVLAPVAGLTGRVSNR